MKKMIVLLMCCSMLLTTASCTKEKELDKSKENKVLQENNSNEIEKENPKTMKVNIYKINPDNEKRVIEVKECTKIDEKVLWGFLKEAEIVPQESNVLSLKLTENRIELDVDNVFGDWLRTFGTTGEEEIISCIVNTYLDAYKAKEIKITESGQVLCSGHTEYTEYLGKFE
ncbi:GerMN domain-containing protein [Faecalimonas sp.]